jgi:hypothetical protein
VALAAEVADIAVMPLQALVMVELELLVKVFLVEMEIIVVNMAVEAEAELVPLEQNKAVAQMDWALLFQEMVA